jgi:alkanesulfonate monooxygenase SsuD/methylene tetrahydromethanopterin reductase-like flavin-dependent oxidoreductase (luciferase family)
VREDIPIYLAAEGPKNIALAAEICDGWVAMLLSPEVEDMYRGFLQEGWGRDGARRSEDDFEVVATVPFLVSDDVQAAADSLRPFYALYFGGMGAKGKNFHANVAIRMGYESMIDEVQELYLSGKKEEAGAAIPFELIEQMSLIGPADKIKDDVEKWRESFVTTLLIAGDVNTVRQAAEIVLG